jgi:hypothetical protein
LPVRVHRDQLAIEDDVVDRLLMEDFSAASARTARRSRGTPRPSCPRWRGRGSAQAIGSVERLDDEVAGEPVGRLDDDRAHDLPGDAL